MGRLDGRVAIITGASSGIGKATAERFVAEGARVALASRGAEAGQAIAEALGEAAMFVPTDVGSPADLERLMAAVIDRWGQIDCLFNNAGEGAPVFSLEEITAEVIDQQFDTLVKSVMLGTKLAAPHLRATRGTVINNASIAAHGSGFAPVVYSAAKAAVLNFTRWASMELAPHGVRVNSISPGYVYTPIFNRVFGVSDEEGAKKAGEVQAVLASATHTGRCAEPADIAAVALFFASDDSRNVTGQDVIADGGLLAGWSTTQMLGHFANIMKVFGIEPPS